MRLSLISLCFVASAHFLVGCGASNNDPRDLGCEDSQCNSPPQNGCFDNVAVGFSQAGYCERGECIYEQNQTPCAEGTTCRAGICVLEEDACEGVVCQDPPLATCNASDVVTYPGVGECQEGQCVYQAVYTPCGAEEVCVNAQCYSSDDPCVNITCDSPPEKRCEGNAIYEFGTVGTCTNGECAYPVIETSCGETATCVDGECDESINPCEGIECISPPPRTCAGDTVIIYDATGVCQQGECKYSASEEFCAEAEVCSQGSCIDPCTEVICSDPPQDNCIGNDLHSFAQAGTCSVGVCSYAETVTPCGGDKICYEADCHFIPGAGDLVITEIMYDPIQWDKGYEWFEIHNPTENSIYIGGLIISDKPIIDGSSNSLTIPDGIQIASGAYTVFAKFSDAVDGGVTYEWNDWGTFILANNDDEIILTYGNTVVDRVEYNEDTTFPEALGASLSLDPTQDASSNDDGGVWCFGLTAYDGLSTPDSPKGYGSPGQANPACDFMCFDVACSTLPNTCDASSETLALQYSGPGVCNSTTGECNNEVMLETVDCVASNGNDLNYICQNGECIDGCEGVFCATAPNATCSANSLITYLDAGVCVAGVCEHPVATTLDCGSDTCVEAETGAECMGDPCEGMACEAPTAWCDGGTIVEYSGSGNCEGGTCNYQGVETRRDCLASEACYNAECVQVPQEGDLIITEYLANPGDTDDYKEWFEIYNTRLNRLYLGGMIVKDMDQDSVTIAEGTFVEGHSYFVFGWGATSIVGGPDFDWSTVGFFQLANETDEIILEYGGAIIDSVMYSHCDGCFPHPNGASVSLEPTLISSDNNVGAHWCKGTSNFGVGTSLGTPGVANTPCFACTDATLAIACPIPSNYCDDAEHALQYSVPACVNDYCDYTSAASLVDCGNQVCFDGACIDSPD